MKGELPNIVGSIEGLPDDASHSIRLMNNVYKNPINFRKLNDMYYEKVMIWISGC